MGTWGPAIFSDDTASDIRGDYKDFLGDGLSPSDATDRILLEWKDSIDDSDEQSVVWLALAVIQWKLGRLEERIKEKAIEVINSGCDLDRWDGKDKEKRKIVLEKVKVQLESPQPVAKKVPKRFRDHCEWEVGEIISYTTLSQENILFRVIGYHEDKGGKGPVCELLNWKGKVIPGKFKLRFLGIKKKEYPQGNYTLSQFLIGRTSEKELPKCRVRQVGMHLKPSQKVGGFTVFLWKHLDKELEEFFGIN
ncbi:hypothetical protein DIT71_03230 [Marinobacter vulgaris]|uniref:DUF4259 domain-containing protein n=1 Tax=Marinobacter vulgaris TaxID=1928331 RepID=A0A2V3ZQN8_9GAMM|nr:hypothetical protein [Marinobacter vulgaris]PXX93824.1 hypothetical protein DIT71_03230 [Marinobacter vulgaris]TSJ72156.1 hypothetical protein FPC41_00040 [Marinobacter vulgaris]